MSITKCEACGGGSEHLNRGLEVREVDVARQAAALRDGIRIAKLGVWELNTTTRRVYFSPELRALLGLADQEEWPLDDAVNLWAPADRGRFVADLERAESNQSRLDFEGRLVDRFDPEIWLRVVGEPALERGKCAVFRGATQDISEQRQVLAQLESSTAEARAANAAKSAFLSNLSHEIRTPLNAVLGMSQALAREALAPVQREQVQVIGRAGKELLDVIDDLLDLSAIEAGRLELNCGVANLVEIAGAVEALFRPAAREKDLQLSLRVSSGAGGDWHCDERRVRQVLTILVANAVKFTEQGEVSIILDQGPEGVVLSVADTGPGIPSGLRGRLFEPFVQGDSSLTRLHRGVGLGLAICHELVRLMGGDISVTSVVGEGATFAVRLPLEAAEAPPKPIGPHPPEASEGIDAELRILVAEDNSTNRLIIETFFNQIGVRPRIVGDGQALVEAWREERWDLILTDIQMPVMDGLAAARRIRAEEQKIGIAPTPILAVSANALPHHAEQYEAAGINGLIPKPIDFSNLIRVIDETVRERPRLPRGA
jgi:signal transduction histidine kinase